MKMNKKILVIEDEVPIRKFTAINLSRNDFEVVEAGSGEDGLEIIQNEFIDLILLDVMLPGMNGFETCEAIRQINPNVPIIMLTAKGQDQDKIHGFQSGGDDYVIKPFNPLELIARIKAILKRTTEGNNYHAGYATSHGITINLRTREATKNGSAVDLTQREFRLLSLLMENAGIAISRDEIMDRVWHDVVTEPKTIDVYIRRLRGKIEDNPAKPDLIETVWGVGYRWRR
jgi:DNA-binding response OmpR family regulator